MIPILNTFNGVEELGKELKKMKLGGNKLVVNLARYANENADAFPSREKVVSDRGGGGWPRGGYSNPQFAPEKAREVKKGFSFADILMNKSCLVMDEDSIEIDPSINTLSEVVGMAVVARALDLQVLRKLNFLLWEAGFQGVDIQYIGGFSVMENWFSKVEAWKGQAMPFERLAWIMIFGVPPHLLASTVFDDIGRKYGRIVQGSQMSEKDDNLSYDRIGILTDSGNKISGIIKLRWQDKVYRVWVVEESDPWSPDCIDKAGSAGEDESLSSEFSVPAFVSPVMGEKTHGEVEGMISGNVKADLAGGDVQQAIEENEVSFPREQEDVGGQNNNGCFNFAAQSNSGLDGCNRGPSLVDHWANLVGHSSPRPRKRPRNNDTGLIDEMWNKDDGPRAVNINGNKEFNLNKSPRGSEFDQNMSSGALEEGEIGEGLNESVEEVPVRILEEEIEDTIEFGKIVGTDLSEETNRSVISAAEIDKFWGSSDWKMECVNPSGRSGGLLSVWDASMFSVMSVIKDPNFLITSGFIKGVSDIVNVVNIYGPQKPIDKRALWDRLLSALSAGSGLWLLVGDFNVVRRAEERKNSRFKPQCANDFNAFVAEADLFEYDLKGSRFTYMVEGGVLENPPSSWLERPDLENVVESAMGEFTPSGPPDLNLIKKFRFLRQKLRNWRDEIRSKEGEIEEEARAKLEELDLALENRELSEEEEWIRLECKQSILELDDFKLKDLKQRARSKWAMEGDDNTAYFHGVVNGRKSSNAIHGFNVNNQWISKPKKIKKLVFEFFREKFKEDAPERPYLELDNAKRISEAEAAALIEQFSIEEIKQAVFDCGSDRAPGPDGFNMKFIKRFWRFFEEDFKNIFDMFFDTGTFSRGTTSSFIVLIPKEKDPIDLGNYRPINLIGILNKVISKALANRLKLVIGGVISANQTAFLKDRLILDGPLILNEAIGWLKKMNQQACFFKIDFAKAYDNVNWNFVILMMEQMGFPNKWCEWVFGILSSARSSVLVNGSPTFEFPCFKASRVGAFRGIVLPNNGPTLTHLLYADDCVLLGEWSRSNIRNMALLLRVFNIVSGLQINMGKSCLMGIGVSSRQVDVMAKVLNCKKGSIPFFHLGVLVGARMSRVSNWKSVTEVIEARLSLWKAATLSIGGRVTLIKSVLESIPNYHLSLFKAPAVVIQGIEKIIRPFLWGGNQTLKKMHWVAWGRVTAPINRGGIGLASLKEVNIALLCKWIWRFKTEASNLWKDVIISIHGHNRSWNFIPVNNQLSGVWKGIVKLADSIKVGNVSLYHNFKGIVGNGYGIQFWIDPWACNRPLLELFPNLFRLEKNKRCLVHDRFDNESGSFANKWEWRRWPSLTVESAEFDALLDLVHSFGLSDSVDRWEWIGGDKSEFSVKAVKDFLRSGVDYSRNFVFKWSKWAPKKCNIFIWRAEMGRIATVDALSRRNC
ncbi:putative RNA-directed DNA polymerase [Helianthus annuus]|nr:putative RNA-directed DNA polymerase [Helianthus annuus]